MTDQKLVLITGATGGIGQALCKEFKKNDFVVIGTDRTVKQSDHCDMFIEIDLYNYVKDADYCQSITEKLFDIVNSFNCPVYGLVNNAAVQIIGPLADLTVEDWDQTLSVNLSAPFLLVKSLMPLMKEKGGSVVNIGSVHAVATKPEFSCYATSKAGLAGLTRSLAVELGPDIRVNMINPAAVQTDMLMDGFKDNPEKFKELSAMHPIKRIADPEELAKVVVFLMSDEASFITGSTLNVDGGILSCLHDPV